MIVKMTILRLLDSSDDKEKETINNLFIDKSLTSYEVSRRLFVTLRLSPTADA